MDGDALSPCRFCGEPGQVREICSGFWVARCVSSPDWCCAQTGLAASADEAAELWENGEAVQHELSRKEPAA